MTLVGFLNLLGIVFLVFAAATVLQAPIRKKRIFTPLFLLITIFFINSLPGFVKALRYEVLVTPFEEYIQILLPVAFFIVFTFIGFEESEYVISSRNKVLTALHTMTENLQVDLKPEELWKNLLEHVIEVMAFNGGFLNYDGEERVVNVAMGWDGDGQFSSQLQLINIGDTILSEVYISGKPLIVERTEIMPDSLVQALHLSGVKSVALFPVKSERKVLGVLGVVSTRHYIFTEEELDLFTLLGHHFGEVIQNSIYIEGTMDQAGEIKTAREGRRQFLNRISNDLGGPVMRIRTVIQTLTDDAGNREDRDVLRILGETSSDSEILERLIDDVRELADLDSEGGRLNAMPMDLMKELWRIKEQLQVKADDKEITLSLRYNHELEPVEADRDMIQSALRHMLSNAIKYTPEKGAVSIDAWEDNQMTYISIADTGIGIDEEASGKIFDMFYRASIARDLVKSGTGLGLTIVNRIVELHRGELVCRPGEGGGTVFVVKLPRMQLGEERQ